MAQGAQHLGQATLTLIRASAQPALQPTLKDFFCVVLLSKSSDSVSVPL